MDFTGACGERGMDRRSALAGPYLTVLGGERSTWGVGLPYLVYRTIEMPDWVAYICHEDLSHRFHAPCLISEEGTTHLA